MAPLKNGRRAVYMGCGRADYGGWRSRAVALSGARFADRIGEPDVDYGLRQAGDGKWPSRSVQRECCLGERLTQQAILMAAGLDAMHLV